VFQARQVATATEVFEINRPSGCMGFASPLDMNDKRTKARFTARPLLVASVGIAMLSMGACGGFTSGNLMVPRCPDGGFDNTGHDCEPVDAGTKDAGPNDGGTKDAGTDDGGLGGDH